jgi:PKD repeat protein
MKIKHIFLIVLTLVAFVLSSCKEDEIDAPLPSSQADFSYTVSNNAIAPAKVTIANKSINTNYFSWDFGNDQTSEAENPTITYEEPGIYDITLTIEPQHNLYYNRTTKTAQIKIKGEPLKSLYFTSKYDNKTYYSVIDTTEAIISELGDFTTTDGRFLVIDTTNAFAYISDKGGQQIIKAALDGSSVESILTLAETSEGGSPWGITIANNQLYFAIENTDGFGKIMRCNLDGSNAEVAVDISDFLPLGLTYNPDDEMLYFANDGYYDDGGIWRVNTDGTGLEVVVQNHNGSPVDGAGLAIDHKNEYIFYTHFADQSIILNNYNGDNPITIGSYTNAKLCYGVTVDIDAGYVYWSDRPEDDANGNGNIFRVRYLDESGALSIGIQEKWIDGNADNVDIAPYGIGLDTYR